MGTVGTKFVDTTLRPVVDGEQIDFQIGVPQLQLDPVGMWESRTLPAAPAVMCRFRIRTVVGQLADAVGVHVVAIPGVAPALDGRQDGAPLGQRGDR